MPPIRLATTGQAAGQRLDVHEARRPRPRATGRPGSRPPCMNGATSRWTPKKRTRSPTARPSRQRLEASPLAAAADDPEFRRLGQPASARMATSTPFSGDEVGHDQGDEPLADPEPLPHLAPRGRVGREAVGVDQVGPAGHVPPAPAPTCRLSETKSLTPKTFSYLPEREPLDAALEPPAGAATAAGGARGVVGEEVPDRRRQQAEPPEVAVLDRLVKVPVDDLDPLPADEAPPAGRASAAGTGPGRGTRRGGPRRGTPRPPSGPSAAE